jgi:hypothetical protein
LLAPPAPQVPPPPPKWPVSNQLSITGLRTPGRAGPLSGAAYAAG